MFLEKHPTKYYAIRDKALFKRLFKLKAKYEDVLNEIRGYSLFTINVSSYNYVNNQILNGELEILENGEVWGQISCDSLAIGRTDDPNNILIKNKYF